MRAEFAVLIHLLPLLGGLLIGLFGFRLRERSWKLGVPAIAIAFLLSLWTLYTVSLEGMVRVVLFEPHPSFPSPFRFSLLIDRLSAVMMVLVTGVSLIVHVYSVRYMQGERGYARFFALLGFVTSTLLVMVCSANLLMLFVCWQLVSWLLYLLLAYNYMYRPSVDLAFKSFLVLRLGDVAFLAGVLLAYATYGTLEFPELFARAAATAPSFPFWPGGPEISAATAVTLLLFVGAMAKSAQFPLHVWLPDTMDTPTPVSALMHAGIVNAAGFLINRLAPLYGLAPTTLHVAFVVGSLTAILGAAMMLTQSDVKKMLGFSTMGQMGYMTMECGLGAFALAIFHLIAHGIFKATLFLYAGRGIHEARYDPRSPTGHEAARDIDTFPRLSWFTGVSLTLIVPLVILLASHGLLHIPLQDQQGAVIFLFFAWVTSSQAILSLYRLKAVETQKVAAIMVLALGLVLFTYLWAAETFTYFLYPAPGVASRYFQAAAFPLWLFHLFVGTVAVLLVVGWVVVYTNARGRRLRMTVHVAAWSPRLYMWLWNRLLIDDLYAKARLMMVRTMRRVNATLPDWLL